MNFLMRMRREQQRRRWEKEIEKSSVFAELKFSITPQGTDS